MMASPYFGQSSGALTSKIPPEGRADNWLTSGQSARNAVVMLKVQLAQARSFGPRGSLRMTGAAEEEKMLDSRVCVDCFQKSRELAALAVERFELRGDVRDQSLRCGPQILWDRFAMGHARR
jgi:hypothetical protein